METERGLTEQEAGKRLREYGPNQLKKGKRKSAVCRFWEQLQDPLIYVLLVAAAVSVLLSEYSDACIIVIVVLLNACVGMLQEGKAQRALEELQNLQSPHACVIRDGRKKEILAQNLVPGDLVCLEAGCRVPADLLLTESIHLCVEESALTGESQPVEKDAGFQAKKGMTALGDQKNRAFMSTIVTGGRGMGVVEATGMRTELGRIADMIHQEKEEMTPLQKRLGDLGKVLSLLSLLLCGALFGIAILQKRDVIQMLITAISLAVAAVPEGLPAVVTICLALSVTRMVKAGTIVRRLPSVETLGAVSVVCSDKTGTLTQNRMTVQLECWDGRIHNPETEKEAPPGDFICAMVLCNDAVLEEKKGTGKHFGFKGFQTGRKGREETGRVGDPMETALLEAGRRYGVEKGDLSEKMPRTGEVPFDSGNRKMITWHRDREGKVGYCKGAPDVVLDMCSEVLLSGRREPLNAAHKEEIRQMAQELSSQAYRMLALCCSREQEKGQPVWVFLGMTAIQDPVRPEAAKAVGMLKRAGVRTLMITGDHVETAFAIGKQTGIAQERGQCITGEEMTRLKEGELTEKMEHLRVFARVSPSQKMQIVRALRDRGEIVAMTGDGVNDAPSLKAADIGIAMGKSGTDVAKQAADMILVDDNFATLEMAVEEGRGVYENIRKSVIFLLSSNLGELLTMFTAVLTGFASPLKSSHILWINLITDSLPALALGVDRNDGRALMQNRPRKSTESLFARGGLGCTCFYGFLIAGISLTAFFWPILPAVREAGDWKHISELLHTLLRQPEVLRTAQTYAFTVLGMSQLFHAVGMRDVEKSVFRMNHLENGLMILACVVGFALQFAVTEVPVLVRAFGTAPLKLQEWLLLTGLAAVPLLAHELLLIAGSFCNSCQEKESSV